MDNSINVPVTKIDLDNVAVEDRFSIWKETVSIGFDSVLKPEEQLKPFFATLTTYHLSSLLLSSSTSCSQYLNRDLKLIAKDGIDHCMIQLYLKGSTSGQWGKHGNSTVRPGDIFLLDLTQPVQSYVKSFDTLFLVVPRGMLLSTLPQLEHLHGKVLPRESAVAKLLGAHIKTLYSVSQSLTETEVCSVAEGVVNLTGTYFSQTQVDEDCQHVQAATRESIRCYITENLHNPELNAESIAHHFKISRAYLYRLFDSSEGITHYIYERRLLKAFNCLINPGNSSVLISQIAYSLGFNSESHFSRSFRQFFGMTPSEVRNNARSDGSQQNSNIIAQNKVFKKWVLSLQ